MTETEISRTVLDVLRLAFPPPGAWWHRNNTGKVKRKGGCFVVYGLGNGGPDIVGCVDGRWVAVEVKVPGKWQEPDQQAWQVQHELSGGVYVLAHDAREAIDGVKRGLEVAA
ncbi:MAG: hypothetical protein WC683_09360 [bacterium]